MLAFLNRTDRYVDGSTVVVVQHDNEKTFLAKHFQNVAIYSGVVSFTTSPYEHQQNGRIERFNQTIQRMVTTAMHDSNAPESVVAYCIMHCVHVYDVVPVEALE